MTLLASHTPPNPFHARLAINSESPFTSITCPQQLSEDLRGIDQLPGPPFTALVPPRVIPDSWSLIYIYTQHGAPFGTCRLDSIFRDSSICGAIMWSSSADGLRMPFGGLLFPYRLPPTASTDEIKRCRQFTRRAGSGADIGQVTIHSNPAAGFFFQRAALYYDLRLS